MASFIALHLFPHLMYNITYHMLKEVMEVTFFNSYTWSILKELKQWETIF